MISLENNPLPETCLICGGKQVAFAKNQPEDYEYGVLPARLLRIIACKGCRSRFIHPRPTVEELISFYPSDYHAYNEDHGGIAEFLVSLRSKARAKHLLSLSAKRPVRLFDVGTGDCRHFDALRSYGEFSFGGIEINASMVGSAKERGYNVEQGTLEGFSLDGQKANWDVITMYQLVEHVLNPHLLMQKAFEMLTPGGWVLGQLPCGDSLESALFGRYWAGYHYPRHLQMLSRKGLSGVLSSAGFNKITVKSALHLQAGLSLQNALVGRCHYHPQMTFGKIPAYSLLLLAVAPYCILEHVAGKGGMMNFAAQKPEEI